MQHIMIASTAALGTTCPSPILGHKERVGYILFIAAMHFNGPMLIALHGTKWDKCMGSIAAIIAAHISFLVADVATLAPVLAADVCGERLQGHLDERVREPVAPA